MRYYYRVSLEGVAHRYSPGNVARWLPLGAGVARWFPLGAGVAPWFPLGV